MMGEQQPRISIVIASHNARTSVKECLAALVPQIEPNDAEILVVDNSTDGTPELIRENFPLIRILSVGGTALIPELWGIGIAQTSGDIVAITTAHFIPDQGWLSQILKAHQTAAVAVGGAIENSESAGLVDWAVYFCRYSSYMLPFRENFVPDIAGDNASYRRSCIEQYRDIWKKGFWEPEVHAQLKKAGFCLLLTPSIVVHHKRSFNLWSFIHQRYFHGIQFGRARAGRFPLVKRILYMMLSPAIPFLFLARISRQVFSKRRYQAKFLQALPVLILFLSAWTLGEFVGYLKGAPAR